jgi:hypothetical protein
LPKPSKIRIVEIPFLNQERKFLTDRRGGSSLCAEKFAPIIQRVIMPQNNRVGLTGVELGRMNFIGDQLSVVSLKGGCEDSPISPADQQID